MRAEIGRDVAVGGGELGIQVDEPNTQSFPKRCAGGGLASASRTNQLNHLSSVDSVCPTLALTRADCGARATRAASGAAPCSREALPLSRACR